VPIFDQFASDKCGISRLVSCIGRFGYVVIARWSHDDRTTRFGIAGIAEGSCSKSIGVGAVGIAIGPKSGGVTARLRAVGVELRRNGIASGLNWRGVAIMLRWKICSEYNSTSIADNIRVADSLDVYLITDFSSFNRVAYWNGRREAQHNGERNEGSQCGGRSGKVGPPPQDVKQGAHERRALGFSKQHPSAAAIFFALW
jgi:hypothetical protein